MEWRYIFSFRLAGSASCTDSFVHRQRFSYEFFLDSVKGECNLYIVLPTVSRVFCQSAGIRAAKLYVCCDVFVCSIVIDCIVSIFGLQVDVI